MVMKRSYVNESNRDFEKVSNESKDKGKLEETKTP